MSQKTECGLEEKQLKRQVMIHRKGRTQLSDPKGVAGLESRNKLFICKMGMSKMESRRQMQDPLKAESLCINYPERITLSSQGKA